jgi:hypothetical protein
MAQLTCREKTGTLLDVTGKNWDDHIKVSGSGYRRGQSKLHTLTNKV